MYFQNLNDKEALDIVRNLDFKCGNDIAGKHMRWF
jgi:hypothetical protein